jgi:hypothetical protein
VGGYIGEVVAHRPTDDSASKVNIGMSTVTMLNIPMGATMATPIVGPPISVDVLEAVAPNSLRAVEILRRDVGTLAVVWQVGPWPSTHTVSEPWAGKSTYK